MAAGRKHMSFTIRNFGPIREGRITLKPLTILVGPNSSGKSYAAMAIHSILKSHPVMPSVRKIDQARPGMRFSSDFWKYLPDIRTRSDSTVKRIIDDLAKNSRAEVPKPLVNAYIKYILSGIYSASASREMAGMFARRITDLARKGSRSFTIDVGYEKISVALREKSGMIYYTHPPIDLKITIKADAEYAGYDISWESHTRCTIHIGWRLVIYSSDRFVTKPIMEACMEYITADAPRQSHYLPAIRSGIVQSHKTITQSIIRSSEYAGIENVRIEKLPGQFSDMLSNLLSMDPKHETAYSEITKKFELELIGGRIQVRKMENLAPQITYQTAKYNLHLHHASSAISEMATMFLYLRYFVRKGDMLMIEEPEAHLHPANQRVMAQFITRLIRNGLRILVTTHSPYFMESVNMCLLQGNTAKGRRSGEFLDKSEVSVHLFRKTGHDTHVIEEIAIDDEIPGDEFTRVDDALYEDRIRLVRAIGAKNGQD